MAINSICGMEIDEKEITLKSEYKEKSYYFYALGSKADFDSYHEKYLKAEGLHQHNGDCCC